MKIVVGMIFVLVVALCVLLTPLPSLPMALPFFHLLLLPWPPCTPHSNCALSSFPSFLMFLSWTLTCRNVIHSLKRLQIRMDKTHTNKSFTVENYINCIYLSKSGYKISNYWCKGIVVPTGPLHLILSVKNVRMILQDTHTILPVWVLF